MKKSKLLLTLLICTMMFSACSSQKPAEQSSETQSTSETQSSAESRNDPSQIDLNAGKLKGADSFAYADEWELLMDVQWVTSKDGDYKKNFLPAEKEVMEKAYNDYTNVKVNNFRYNLLPFQYYQAIGAASPNMRKITEDEFISILRSAAYNDNAMQILAADDYEWVNTSMNQLYDHERSEKVYEAVRDIQYFADAYQVQSNIYSYWLECNNPENVRTELLIRYEFMELYKNTYDENGDMITRECLYSYPYELEKAALEKYGSSEKRDKNRMADPYEKIEYKEPEAPDPDKKLTGAEVKIPSDQQINAKNSPAKAAEIQKQAEEYGYPLNAFEYQLKVASGQAYPNMRKITVDEVREIFEKAAEKNPRDLYYDSMHNDDIHSFPAWMSENIIKEVKKIQYYPDAYDYRSPYFGYWPDADTVDERRQEIRIYTSLGKACLLNYDEEGNRINIEIIYDLIDNR